ncbi:hypothetical protein VKT23_010484 [Stygiomarasmius scandens]|uniref:Uncharacterized protein n=1 Tax=Marasmiellus scandens TaxID=2682957 RepID=A0ABR1JCS7_9AGAR
MTAWLVDSALFEQAWTTVCAGPLNWWWSEQICAYTVGAWTAFLFLQGQKYKIKHIWAYMLLGQLVAISVACNLFYLALSLSPKTQKQRSQSLRAKPILWLSILTSLSTVAYTPYTSEQTFFPNLLIMHATLTIPLLYVSFGKDSSSNASGWFSISFKTLYTIVFILTSLLRIRTYISAFKAVPYYTASESRLLSAINLLPLVEALWQTLHSHPAQSSIGWDAVWTSGSFVMWAWLEGASPLSLRSLLVNTIVGSAGVMAPLVELVSPVVKSVGGKEGRKTD